MLKRFALAAIVALAAGCSKDSADTDETSSAEPPADAGLLEPQRQALERAGSVEDDLAEAARRQRQAIEDNEDSDGGG